MPPSVSNVSLKLLEAVRVDEGRLDQVAHPVWIESRLITGFYPALELKRLISEREDLSYIGKVNRNADRNGLPGFSFVREGAESLNEYIKIIEAQARAVAAAGNVA